MKSVFIFFYSKEYCIHLFAYNMLGNISSPVPLTPLLVIKPHGISFLPQQNQSLEFDFSFFSSSSSSNAGPLHQEFLDKLLTTLSDISSE